MAGAEDFLHQYERIRDANVSDVDDSDSDMVMEDLPAARSERPAVADHGGDTEADGCIVVDVGREESAS